jgi:hypothetical protein
MSTTRHTNEAPSKPPRYERQAQILAMLAEAGDVGLTAEDIARRLGMAQQRATNRLRGYLVRGLCRGVMDAGVRRYFAVPGVDFRSTQRSPRGAVLRKAARAATRVNNECASPASPPVVPRAAPVGTPVVEMRGGVRVVHCPAGLDLRYTAEPGYVGPFMSEWRAKRQGVVA